METQEPVVLPTNPEKVEKEETPQEEPVDNKVEKVSESKEVEDPPKEETFFEKYKYHLLILGILILAYLGYVYYCYTNDKLPSCFGSVPEMAAPTGNPPLEPFFSPQDVANNATQAVQSVAEVVKTGVKKAV